MWGDAKELGDHEVAEADPFRWSDWLNVVGTIADLEAYNTPANQNRAVELVKGSSKTDNMLLPMRFGSISEAISYLSAMTTTQPPVVVEKTQKVVIPGLGAGDCASRLGNMEALGYMAAGSALTVALYVSLCALRRCCWGSMAKAHDEEDSARLLDRSDSDTEAAKPRLAITAGRAPQPYQGQFQENELRALLADIEEEEKLMLTGPRSFKPGGFIGSASALREEALREVERVLNAKGAEDIFTASSEGERRAQYRRLVRLLHPDKKIVDGQRASLALRRVVECYRSISGGK